MTKEKYHIKRLRREIRKAKEYLQETDYIVIKIAELKDDSLLVKYESELAKRKESRALINRLEEEIKEYETL